MVLRHMIHKMEIPWIQEYCNQIIIHLLLKILIHGMHLVVYEAFRIALKLALKLASKILVRDETEKDDMSEDYDPNDGEKIDGAEIMNMKWLH